MLARRGATAAAVGPGAARRGARGEGAARTALGHRRRRSLRGAREGQGGRGEGGEGGGKHFKKYSVH